MTFFFQIFSFPTKFSLFFRPACLLFLLCACSVAHNADWAPTLSKSHVWVSHTQPRWLPIPLTSKGGFLTPLRGDGVLLRRELICPTPVDTLVWVTLTGLFRRERCGTTTLCEPFLLAHVPPMIKIKISSCERTLKKTRNKSAVRSGAFLPLQSVLRTCIFSI